MSNEFLHDRRVALEEAFFAKQNEELRRRLRDRDQARRTREALSAASGITDDVVLDKLAAINIGSEALAALSLVPLVVVAWADGSIDGDERRVAFARAAEVGLARHDVSRRLFEHWLAEPPPPALFAAWKDYIRAFSATLSKEARDAFKLEILDHARAVAVAAGGFLGLGQKISPPEGRVLKELEEAFPE